jgi:UDP-glucose 4-epimerase
MRSVITGGAGFLGCHLAEKLVALKHEVIVLDNFFVGRLSNLKNIKNKIKIIKCDISKKGSWGKYLKNSNYVFHLAALADIVPSIEKPENYLTTNVNGTLNVLQYCNAKKLKKFIYAASSSCYGIPKKYPTKENAIIKPQYPYALSKRMGEEMVLHWNKVYKLKALSLRFFNLYGPRSRTSGTYGAVFGTFLAQKISGLPYTIVGNGKQTRDFTYVSDAVAAIIKASKSNINGEIFNVGSGKTISINYIVKLLKGKKIFIPKRPGEPDKTFADIKKIKKYLKWTPKINIEKGIKLLLKNIDDWKNAPVWTKDKIHIATKSWFKYLK